jgi:hypothetical protein
MTAKKCLWTVLLFILAGPCCFAQYFGGYGDGYYFNECISVTLNNTNPALVGFQGGNGDGYNRAGVVGASLQNVSVFQSVCAGGNGDGYNQGVVLNEPLTTNLLFPPGYAFGGGGGDGYNRAGVVGDSLQDISVFQSVCAGGNGDGYNHGVVLNAMLTTNLLFPPGYAFGGGNGDGYNRAGVVEASLQNVSVYQSVCAGGNGDGYNQGVVLNATLTTNLLFPAGYAFGGGNGDGYSQGAVLNATLTTNLLFPSGYAFGGANGDGYNRSEVAGASLLDVSAFQSVCAGGNGDGYNHGAFLNAALTTNLLFPPGYAFGGGSGDGYNLSEVAGASLQNVSVFQSVCAGGNGDGYNHGVVLNEPLTTNLLFPLGYAFGGGDGDGYNHIGVLNVNLTTNLLFPSGYAFGGGNGDGYNRAEVINLELTTNLLFPAGYAMQGGIGDGYSHTFVPNFQFIINAPLIVQEPADAIVIQGGSALFSVTTLGLNPFYYQWYSQAGALVGQTNSTLSLTNLSLSQSGNSYYVTITNTYGSATSFAATLTVGTPPIIVAQPQSENATNGDPFALTVSVSGTGPLSYQWQFNGTNLADNVNLSGSSTSNLTVNSAGMSNSGNYSVIVTSPFGTATSSNAMVTVVFPPAILTQPQNVITTNGMPVSFYVSATGTPPLSYHWRLNGINLSDNGGVSGSTTGNLTINPAGINNAGSYSVVVSSPFGSVTSSNATLIVGIPPAILTQPTSQIGTNGYPIHFTVSASGTTPMSYRWQFNGTNLSDNLNLIGSSTSNLTVSSVSSSNAGNYSVIVNNAFGSQTSSNAMLTIVYPPVIVVQPLSQVATNGFPVAFNVSASGTAPLNYQWRLNGTNLLDNANVSGSGTSNLTVSSVSADSAGNYSVMVSNPFGSQTSSNAVLAIGYPPLILVQPLSRLVTNGFPVTFNVSASGTSLLNYQWRLNGTNLTDSANVSGSSTSNLTVSSVSSSNAGNFSVIVSNPFGSQTSSNAILTIVYPPAIVVQPMSQVVTNGSPVSLNVTASGTPPLNYQWRLNGTNLMDNANVSGSSTTNLTIAVAGSANAGIYSVTVSSPYGTATSSNAMLTVGFPPAIQIQPQSQFVTNGYPASFNVTASGTPSLHYQWQRNGTNLADGGNIAGTATSNLTLNTSGINDVSNYTVIVANNYGSATSSVAKLTVVLASGQIAYLRSTIGQPWGKNDNEAILNEVFPSWLDLRYETVNPSILFSAANKFIFMEGGDGDATALSTFLANNQSAISSWVTSGGSLFVNAAPNVGGSFSLGFGVMLNYINYSPTGMAVNLNHAIFNGPYLPVGNVFSGFYFGHATLSGTGLSPLLTNSSGGIVLAEQSTGAGMGHLVFGGMTLPSFHSPQPQGSNLLANVLSYAAGLGSSLTFPPQIQTTPIVNGNFQFSWNTVNTYPPVGYQVQYTTNLASGIWINIGSVLYGSGSTMTFSIPWTSGPQYLYRVFLVQ